MRGDLRGVVAENRLFGARRVVLLRPGYLLKEFRAAGIVEVLGIDLFLLKLQSGQQLGAVRRMGRLVILEHDVVRFTAVDGRCFILGKSHA